MPISYRAAQTIIKRGDEPALRRALDEHLDPDLANPNGWTLLMLAAVEGAVPLGQLLLDHGANPNSKNAKGESALEIATMKGHTAFAKLLRAHLAK